MINTFCHFHPPSARTRRVHRRRRWTNASKARRDKHFYEWDHPPKVLSDTFFILFGLLLTHINFWAREDASSQFDWMAPTLLRVGGITEMPINAWCTGNSESLDGKHAKTKVGSCGAGPCVFIVSPESGRCTSFELRLRLFRATLPQLRRRLFASAYALYLNEPKSVRFTEPIPSWMKAEPGSESRKLTTYGA